MPSNAMKRPGVSSLLEYHRPRPKDGAPFATVLPLKDESRACLKRLAAYVPRRTPRYPLKQSAAVLVILFVGRWGDLYVLLSKRAATLSTYAGDTALPGGRVEAHDRNMERTARREAFEEIGLPQDRRKIPLICTLEPFLARNHLIVTPVVVLVTDSTLRPVLNTPEVDSLFSHPLESFLYNHAPFPLPGTTPLFSNPNANDARHTTEPLIPEPSGPLTSKPTHYHTHYDTYWGPTAVRLHSFLTGREAHGMKPVAGLTAAILIEVAKIGYGRSPQFEVEAEDQATRRERIAWAINRAKRLEGSIKGDGIGWDWEREERMEREKRLRRGVPYRSKL